MKLHPEMLNSFENGNFGGPEKMCRVFFFCVSQSQYTPKAILGATFGVVKA